MNEAYVSFDTAKLLKEKGFDWPTIEYYSSSGSIYRFTEGIADICGIMSYQRPTQQMACSWVRKRGIHIMPTIGCDVDRTPRIFYGVVIALFNDYGDIDYRTTDENEYDKPEEAIEAALEYVLKNLI